MSEKSIKFDNKKISNSEFYEYKKRFDNKDEVDVDKLLISKKESYGTNKSF